MKENNNGNYYVQKEAWLKSKIIKLKENKNKYISDLLKTTINKILTKKALKKWKRSTEITLTKKLKRKTRNIK